MKSSQATLPIKKYLQCFQQQLKDGELAYTAGNIGKYKVAIESTGRILHRLCNSNYIELALSLEISWYQSIVKKIESDEHYAECFRFHSQSMWSAGRRLSPGTISSGDSNCIVFIAQNSVLLGHTEVMLLVMEDWKRRYPKLRILFVGLSTGEPKLLSRLAAIGVEAITPHEKLSPITLVHWLRNTLATEKVGIAVWLSLPLWAPFIFGYRIAKRQVFWSLKFHPVHLGKEVVHIGMTKKKGNGIQEIHGKPWLAFQPPLGVKVKIRKTSDRKHLRGIYNNQFLFMTLAREEKFNSSNFSRVVAKILRRCQGSLFIFTGRGISPILEKALVEEGVADQAIFVGWVDTELYSNLADCFLETFPFGCGVTGMQALSHGTPVISMWDSDTLPTFYFEDESQASRFHSNWNVLPDEEAYINAAVDRFQRWRQGEQRTPIPCETIASLDGAKYEQFFKLVTGVCS